MTARWGNRASADEFVAELLGCIANAASRGFRQFRARATVKDERYSRLRHTGHGGDIHHRGPARRPVTIVFSFQFEVPLQRRQ